MWNGISFESIKNLEWKVARGVLKGKNNEICSPIKGPNVIKNWLLNDPPPFFSGVYKPPLVIMPSQTSLSKN